MINTSQTKQLNQTTARLIAISKGSVGCSALCSSPTSFMHQGRTTKGSPASWWQSLLSCALNAFGPSFQYINPCRWMLAPVLYSLELLFSLTTHAKVAEGSVFVDIIAQLAQCITPLSAETPLLTPFGPNCCFGKLKASVGRYCLAIIIHGLTRRIPSVAIWTWCIYQVIQQWLLNTIDTINLSLSVYGSLLKQWNGILLFRWSLWSSKPLFFAQLVHPLNEHFVPSQVCMALHVL